MFNLAALGAGLGQFAQDYRQQQAQQERSLMLALQLADYKRQLDADRRAGDISSLSLGFDPSAMSGRQPQMSPMQAPPQLSAAPLMGPMPQQRPSSFGAVGEYGVGQNTGYPFPTQGVRPGFPRLADASGYQPTSGPGYPGQGAPAQLPGMPAAHEPSAAIPPPSGGQSPAARGFPTTMTTPEQAAGIASGLAGMSPAGQPRQQEPAPVPPPPAQQIAALLRSRNPNMDSRTLTEAAVVIHQRLQAEYKADFDRWSKMQSLSGDAASRAETGRHNVVTEGQGSQRLGIEGRAQAETGRHNLSQEELEKLRIAETERAHKASEQNAAARVQATLGKEKVKTDTATAELDTLANEAEQLAAMVEADPTIVGAKGGLKRKITSVGEQLGVLEEDPALAQFKSRVQLLQARLGKPLLSARYWSGNAQKQMNELLPGLQRWDNPTAVTTSLRNVANILHGTSAATKAASGAVGQDLSKMSDDEIRRGAGGFADEPEK